MSSQTHTLILLQVVRRWFASFLLSLHLHFWLFVRVTGLPVSQQRPSGSPPTGPKRSGGWAGAGGGDELAETEPDGQHRTHTEGERWFIRTHTHSHTPLHTTVGHIYVIVDKVLFQEQEQNKTKWHKGWLLFICFRFNSSLWSNMEEEEWNRCGHILYCSSSGAKGLLKPSSAVSKTCKNGNDWR